MNENNNLNKTSIFPKNDQKIKFSPMPSFGKVMNAQRLAKILGRAF